LNTPLNTIIVYAKDPKKSAEFYRRFFGFTTTGEVVEGLIELTSKSGASLLIHQAAKGVTLGQVGVKLMFDVEDVNAFKEASAAYGLEFGATHEANGYAFANAKDPDKNSIAISSRAFRKRG
jgi:predicted enzyme related to lactoylglutathione lyase